MSNISPEVLKKIRENQQNQRTKLDLSNCNLDYIPDEVFNLTHLQTLDLSSNKLTRIPSAIASLTNLTKLDLTNNQLEKVPSAITNLTTLTVLSLRNNQINYIPNAIENLCNLTELDLSGNEIVMIPPAIAQLTKLIKLDISCNQIQEIPKAIAQLPNLKDFIYIGGSNRITEPKSHIMARGLPGIREHYQVNIGNTTNNQSPIPDNEAENTNKPSPRKTRVKSSWANGSFYLFAFVVVIGLIGYFAGILPPLNLLILVMAGILFVIVIGVLQSLMDGQLSDKSFTEIIIKVIEQLPVIGNTISQILSGNKSEEKE